MKTRLSRFLFTALLAALLSSCTNVPENVVPVKNFNVDRYLGKWYEIARLDHPFERGLEKIHAQYSLRDDGGINVTNRGFNVKDQEWDEALGKAYFVKDSNIGFLKVSFFGPFYSSYIIAYLDDDYQTALISGSKKNYFWILSRTPNIDDAKLKSLISRGKELGFKTDELIFVRHEL
ncbi:lipocalin family protein [Sessilibacter sp. MAH1]